jgi:hypothetical protein
MVGYQFRIFMYSDSVQIKACDWSQASRRCPWRVLANSKPNQSVPVQPSGRAFEGVLMPCSVQQIMLKTSERQSNTFRTARSINIQHGVGFQKSTLLGSLCKPSGWRGNTSRCYPTFQNIPVFHSNQKGVIAKDCSNALPSRPDVDLIRIKLRYFWKDIAEVHPDVANFHPNARQPETESQQF